MPTFVIRRLLSLLPVLFFVALASFFLMHQAPGGPFDRDGSQKRVDPATLAALEARFGLDKPSYVNPVRARAEWAGGTRNPVRLGRAFFDSQFFNYLGNALRGDLGPSYRERGKSVQEILGRQWPYSARLGLVAAAVAVLVGVPLGVAAALRQNSAVDVACLFCATVGFSVPAFVTGLLVIAVFGGVLGWISITGTDWGSWRSYLAPGLVLGMGTMSYLARITRATMLEVKRQDYIRTARAKGVPERLVVGRHMLRNALIPVVTLLGPAVVDLVTGGVIVESIFGVPGVGGYFVDSIFQRDYSMIMGTTLVYAALIVLANLAVDVSYGLLDPRIRQQG
jgi:oligopeptide transport system permease protein